MGKHGPSGVLRWTLAAATGAYRLHCKTLRSAVLLGDGSVIEPRNYTFDREIFALSEADALALGGFISGAGFTVLVTIGADGDRAAFVLEKLGCAVVRGSSRHRGAEALRRLVGRLDRSTTPAAIVVDGPLGPAGIAKSGAVACAVLTGRPLHALAASASRSIVFPNTWSGIYLPAPFSRLAVVCDARLQLPDRSGLDDAERLSEALTERLRLIRSYSQRGIICPPNEVVGSTFRPHEIRRERTSRGHE